MTSKNHYLSRISILILILIVSSLAQNQVKYLYLDDPIYEYMDYLINSGKLSPDFVFYQPYEFNPKSMFNMNQNKSDVNPVGVIKKDSLNDANPYVMPNRYFKDYWDKYYTNESVSTQLGLTDRLYFQDQIYNRYKLSGAVHLTTENITLANRTTVDQNYKYDPNFAGDLSESSHWLYGRVNDAYVNLRYNRLNIFFGRMHRNWGSISSSSLILSNNPYTYDHFLFSYTWDKLKLSLIFARLENVDAYLTNINNSTIQEIPNSRKYLVGHRVDVNLYDNFQIALTEMATYGGPDRDIELAFFNPMNFYYALQRNDNQPINGMWNIDIFYKPVPYLTLYGQFLLDDIVINNDPGVDDRARFPDRLGIKTSVRSADFMVPGMNIDFTYIRIWNRTYQSKVSYENYHYWDLGLGYPCASCEEFKFKLGLWTFFPLFIQNETIIGRYGNVSLTDPFPLKKESFPVKPVTENFVNITKLKYFYSPSVQLFFNMYYFDKKNHYLNRIFMKDDFRIELGLSASLFFNIFNP